MLSAECFLLDATPDQVIRTLEVLGATRDKQYGLVWLYPSEQERQLLFSISVALWPDGERLGLGSTIVHEIIADMTLDEYDHWLEAVATAFTISVDQARSLITEECNVIVRCHVFDERAVGVLRGWILALFAEANGLVRSGRRGWTSQSLRDHPADLQFSTL